MHRNTVVAIAGVAAVVLSLSACNSSKKSSATSTAAAIASAASAAQAATSAKALSAPAPASVASQPAPASSPTVAGSSLAAAGSPAAAGSVAAGAINACALLSVSKAESITGSKYSDAKDDTPDPGDQICSYTGEGNGSDLLVYLFTPSYDTTWDVEVASSTSGPVTNVPGVGKRAMSSGINFLFDTGKYYINIQFADDSGDKNAIALAKQILTAPGVA